VGVGVPGLDDHAFPCHQALTPGNARLPSLARAALSVCTRGVQGMYTGCTRAERLCIRCTSGVHPLYTT
jgi:hypothetical protein